MSKHVDGPIEQSGHFAVCLHCGYDGPASGTGPVSVSSDVAGKIAEAFKDEAVRALRAGPPGPIEACQECGRAMVWQYETAVGGSPAWMCPNCVYRQMEAAEDELHVMKWVRKAGGVEGLKNLLHKLVKKVEQWNEIDYQGTQHSDDCASGGCPVCEAHDDDEALQAARVLLEK